MSKKLTYIFFIALFGWINNYAQNTNKPKITEKSNNKNCNTCKKGEHANPSPYTITFNKEIPFIATATGLVTAGWIAKNIRSNDPFTLEELNALNGNDINRFDKGAISNNSSSARKISDIIQYSGLALPLLFLSNHHTRDDFIPLIVMGAEIFAITGGLTLNSKFIVNRTRPLTYNDDFSIASRTAENNRLSFFSGHTAQTAAFSIFITKTIQDYHPNMRMGLKIGFWAFGLGLPAAAGYFRVKGGKHFNTDVITGYTVGAIVGWLVPELHKKKKVDSKLSLSPFSYEGANGLSLTLKLD